MNNPFDILDSRLTTIESLLLDLKHQPIATEFSDQAINDQLLTIKQAAELLTLSVPTIYGLVSKREIPVNKRGKRLYFSRNELMEWVKSGRKMTNSEISRKTEQFLNSTRKSK